MAKRITIQDIAREAGVSYQTVSRVINNKPDVADSTRSRVEEVIQRLGYRPNILAQSLRSNSTKTIGLIVPDSANPFFAEIAKGVENAGFEAGYSVILCNSAKMPQRETEHLALLQDKGVDGIIFITTTTEIHQISPIVERGVPVVIFYRDTGGLNVDTFKIDNFRAGYLATEYLIQLGHKQIACIRPSSGQTPSGLRVNGYQQALQDYGLFWSENLMPRGDNLLLGGEAATQQMIDNNVPFTAIFAANDAMAIGALRALHASGLQVPQDVSVIGIDDILLAYYIEPPLTTVAQPKQEAGRQAVEYLVERIEGKYEGEPRETILDIELIIRQSCAELKRS